MGARHKQKAFLQVNVGGVCPHVKLHRRRFQGVELIQELLFREDTLGETALVLSWVSMKYFMAKLPCWRPILSCICTT